MTLVKRLLDWKALGVHPDICREAAAEIERLEATTDTSIKDQIIARHVDNFMKQEAEIERLESEACKMADTALAETRKQQAENKRLHARVMELERDNERLRAEIEVLQRMRHASNPTFTLRPWTPEELEQLARGKP